MLSPYLSEIRSIVQVPAKMIKVPGYDFLMHFKVHLGIHHDGDDGRPLLVSSQREEIALLAQPTSLSPFSANDTAYR